MNEQREKVVKASTATEEESRYAQRTMADIRDNLAGTKNAYALFQALAPLEGGRHGRRRQHPGGVRGPRESLRRGAEATRSRSRPRRGATRTPPTPTGSRRSASSSWPCPTRSIRTEPGSAVDGMNQAAVARLPRVRRGTLKMAMLQHRLSILGMLAVSLLSCAGKDPGTSNAAETSTFLPNLSDFADFHTWPSFPAGNDAIADSIHLVGPRRVYINKLPKPGSTEFAAGTIIVKETQQDDVTARDVIARAKRGGTFNAEGAVGWEWWELKNTANQARITML